MNRIVLYLVLILISTQLLLAQEGTLVKDINVSGQVTNNAKPQSVPLGFTQVNDVAYFSADDGIHGRELWKTDGSTAGSVLVSDLQNGASSSNPEQITDVNGTAFFVTVGPSQLYSLWKTGGTAATTIKVRDFRNYGIKGLINVNGTLFFGLYSYSGNMQLWKSDGSSAGTQLVKTFPQTSNFSPVTLNGQLYFIAYDGINSLDLWKSDGTAQGTVLVKDVAVSRNNSVYEGNILYETIAVAGNFVYYIVSQKATEPRDSYILVKSDGTTNGTAVIKQFSTEHVYFSRLTAVNDLVFFIEVDTNAFDDNLGEVVWRTDGTDKGTFPVTKVHTDTYTHNFTAANGLFYFAPHLEKQLWKSDGTVEGTRAIENISSLEYGASIEHMATIGKTLYFTTLDQAKGVELWKTNGTAETTSLAYDMNPNGSTQFYELATLNNTLLISADNGMYGTELFKYQRSTTANTVRINAGGQAFTSAAQTLFNADQYYAGIDRTSSVASGDILNTTNDELYRTGRCSPSFSYNIPVPNGKVNVILHFAEIWYGVPGKGAGGAGKRQFNVTMENSRKLTNFDIFAAAGGAMRAYQKTIPVTVTDGMLNIDFTSGAADLPRISAIEVITTSQTYKVVADSYVREGGFSAANYGDLPELDIKNVAGGDASTKRSAYIRFKLPLTFAIGSAKLQIYGHNHESNKDTYLHAYGVDDDNWAENEIVKNNAPVASTPSLGYVAVNNQYKYYEIDVTSYVKAQQEFGNDLLTLLLADPNSRNNRLVFNSKENSVNAPQLVIQPASVSNSAARFNQEEIAENAQSEQESVIFPNPVKDQFTVSLSMQHAGSISFEMINPAGKSYSLRKAENTGARKKAEVDISGLTLSTGIYMLKIQSDTATEVIKMLVTR
ncbi:DNRLRE domain-containing protein [Dyadobacter flavalbus]|uniref:DNRLRE domain-containing protein n=1 Tax=Dyadobacter flavalbus TaxID=2579942 RepID=A0A5M8QLI5_9BACT|nr:ELWxxDGT repeat protein [Dyadobacter flavalbus]KAA6437067.1 DNRLRE domain-containing protein [Dyadobacter flavalbus]